MKIRLIFAAVVILALVAAGCQSVTDPGNYSSSTTTVRAAAESYRSELPTAGTETTTGAESSGTAGANVSSTAATTAAVTTRTQQRSSAVTTVRSTSAVSDCRHYTVIPGTDIFADTLVWSVEGNYDVWTCSQCGASGRSERQKTSSQLYAEAFASGDYSELNTMETDAVRAIRGVYDALPAGADDFDKICAAADWLYENCSYDYEAAASGNALSSPAFGRWGGIYLRQGGVQWLCFCLSDVYGPV